MILAQVNTKDPARDNLCNELYHVCEGFDRYIHPRPEGRRAEGVYISQITSTHGITNMCHLFVHILCGQVLMKLP